MVKVKSKIIQDILALLFDGDRQGEEVKGQLDFISEIEFDYTGVGVFVSFEHLDGIEKFKAVKTDLILNGVSIKSPGLENGADSALFFKNGLVDYLELSSFSGEFPKHELIEYELMQVWEGSPGRRIVSKKE